MTDIRQGERTNHIGRVLMAHTVHLCVLLVPTLVLAGIKGIGWSIGCFALGITTAGVLESLAVSSEVPVREAPIRDNVAMRVSLLVGVCLLAVFWTAQIESILYGQRSVAIEVTGAALLACGISLRVEAIRALGTQFISDIQVGPAIVRDGIYAWLRHPSEIGLLLIAIGAPLLIGSPFTAIAAATLLLPASLWRMHREDVAWSA